MPSPPPLGSASHRAGPRCASGPDRNSTSPAPQHRCFRPSAGAPAQSEDQMRSCRPHTLRPRLWNSPPATCKTRFPFPRASAICPASDDKGRRPWTTPDAAANLPDHPPELELTSFPTQLAACWTPMPVACVRLALATKDEDRLSRAADALREVTHARDVALVITDHVLLAERLGLDGVHLTMPRDRCAMRARSWAQTPLSAAFCGASRHDGMAAGEAGADYVSFGPVQATALGDGSSCRSRAVPVVVRSDRSPRRSRRALDAQMIAALAPYHRLFRHWR